VNHAVVLDFKDALYVHVSHAELECTNFRTISIIIVDLNNVNTVLKHSSNFIVYAISSQMLK
jgi:hypothetical protein